MLALLGFGWLNVVLLRGLHWLLDIPYQLASLWQHPQVQMTLSISWTLVALVSMQQAARRGLQQRRIEDVERAEGHA